MCESVTHTAAWLLAVCCLLLSCMLWFESNCATTSGPSSTLSERHTFEALSSRGGSHGSHGIGAGDPLGPSPAGETRPGDAAARSGAANHCIGLANFPEKGLDVHGLIIKGARAKRAPVRPRACMC